jgi:hypothetical protein
MSIVIPAGIGKIWHARAPELARWVDDHLVNRRDAYGEYRPEEEIGKEVVGRDGKVYTLGPQKTTKRILTLARLGRHFRATCRADVLGLHTADANNLSKGGGLDIDQHGDDGTRAADNLTLAIRWYDELRRKGFSPLLTDSNDVGGYHEQVLLAEPVPADRVFWFFKLLTAGLDKPPEQFPKQPDVRLCKKRFGNWLRVPGRHHSKDFWSRVWDGSRWLDGDRAIDFILALRGDPPSLIPWDAEWQYRIPPYLAKLPTGMAEGTGRDDVAFNFLAFLVRDLKLADDYALEWVGRWDAGNLVPKGPDRLREILANVHAYGQRPYGSGLNNGQAPPPPATPAGQLDGLGIILADFLERLRPRFKRKRAVFSEALGREVRPEEGCFAPDRVLIDKLLTATDGPKDGNGNPNRKLVPQFYGNWARPAWQEMLRGLDEEDACSEVIAPAKEEFRQAVTKGLHEQVTLGREGQDPQRHSLVDWAVKFAKVGDWKQVRSYLVWCRREKEGDLPQVAVRVELFSQVRRAGLADMSHRTFAALCVLYSVGTKERPDGRPERAGGQRVVVLTPEYLAEAREGAAEDVLTG